LIAAALTPGMDQTPTTVPFLFADKAARGRTVTAMRLGGDTESRHKVADWISSHGFFGRALIFTPEVVFKTAHGHRRVAVEGDYVVLSGGDVRIVAKHVFEATHDLIEDQQ
jgi:hypothetical protein